MPLPSARCVEDQQDSSSEYDSLPDISVVDVFDLASDVGNELEKIISIHGNELVQGLMQKVIRAVIHTANCSAKLALILGCLAGLTGITP